MDQNQIFPGLLKINVLNFSEILRGVTVAQIFDVYPYDFL